MRLKRVLGGMLVVVLVGVGLWMLLRPEPASPLAPPSAPVSTWVEDSGVLEAAHPVEAAAASDAGLWLTATLEGAHPFAGEARVGAAFIIEGDEGWWEEEKRQKAISLVGPSSLEDLANVREWMTAPATASSQGGVVGPVAVPPAPRYQVVAFEPDGTFWWADFVPGALPKTGTLNAGVLRANRPTGVSIRLDGARNMEGAFSVRIERDVDPHDAERASALQPMLALVNPDLGWALVNGSPVPLSPDADTRLAPLPPDRGVRLWLRAPSGREGGPVEVRLREGTVTPVTLDVARLFPEGLSRAVTLRGRVLLGNTSRSGGRMVSWPGGEEPVDADGRFTIPDVPVWRATRFNVYRGLKEEGRPAAPSMWDFDFTPTEEMQGVVDVEWRVPLYRWLVVRMDGFTRAQLKERVVPPYPVYLLERRDAQGLWSAVPSREFVPEEDGMAVSLLEPGTYRVQVASAPYASRPSSVAQMGADDTSVDVRLSPAPSAGLSCEVHVTHQGRPVAGALVMVGGKYRSMPPMRGETDSAGHWRLGAVTSDVLPMFVQGAGNEWEGDGAEACLRSGVVEVRL
ncbi:carboxypeptidase regulatory-like domain-containing protein [Corallococcus exiguus]|uniref:carboxypeptidase regulatory-like domain-containing protein n=1 Tax=Corallococcus exiguus TaxID=83462 RepID=UPI001560FB00|nr:carboxypeptidase regulatory-like domain-containing protein [Corallococcus exiguus]NRD63383.1 carboxypeptidase regulatory-like domain-containing protein [Corallococcus exiguus]